MNQLLVNQLNQSVRYNGKDDTGAPYWEQTVPAVVGSLLGTLGAVIVLFTSLTSPVKAMSKRIIIMISLADILQALPTLLVAGFDMEFHIREGNDYNGHWWVTKSACKWESFFITTGAMLTFLWTFGLSQHMFLLVRFGIKVAYKAYLSLYALSIIPFAVNIVAFQYDVLGKDTFYTRDKKNLEGLSVWCWINVTKETKNSPDFWRQPCPAAFWDGKAFEVFCYIGVTVYCILARHYLKRRASYEQIDSSDDEDEVDRNTANNGQQAFAGAGMRVNKILSIPIALILVRLWGTITRLATYCGDLHDVPSALIVLENLCDPLQGFVNCILYKISLGESCSCPTMIGSRNIQGRGVRRGPSTASHGPVTVWVSPSNSYSSDY